MRIEDEIKQTAFKNEYHKAYINLLYTSNFLQQEHGSLLKPFGITSPQFNVLRILRGQYPKPATVSLLIERMLDKTSNASRIVDKLEAKELVTRKQCPNDRRTVDVLITENGLALLKQLDALDEDNKSGGIYNLTEDDTRELNRILDKIRD
ncbi:MarR family winged helix-turn-helix transcriptional regulator [Pontibacter pudoricolor]|uniref:MarR family winged helix-turn-helix transcriptional regulator n=1 Tax=Pontibacter pudoricolor TaxID=2694930 RepID=UPI0013908AF5|nr:MarR family transcriptional regulator [Pontibacter pudoricolor]